MPTMTVRVYAGGVQSILNKEADTDSDTLKWTLHTSTYTPNYDTDQYVSALSNELSTGSGYTSGGLTATSVVLAKTAANSWSQSWTASTAYTTGQFVRPSTGNGYIYIAQTGGTTGASAPTWPTTLYSSVVDSGVTWVCIGRGAVTLTCANPSWTSFSAGPFRTAVLSDRTPGTAATQPLLCAAAYATDQTGGGGTHTITVDPSGLIVLPY